MEEKFGVFLGEIGFSEFWGETMKMGVKKGRRWCGGERWRLRDAAVVMGNGGWQRNRGFGGVWEKKDGDGGGRAVYGAMEMGERESEQ
jgi:hypothetical protein